MRRDPRLPDNVTPLRSADASRLLEDLLAAASDGVFEQMLARSQLEPWMPAETPLCFTVRVDLDHAKPPIWRRLELAGDLRLDELHDVLQAAMGWTDSHLHHFLMGPGRRDDRREPFVEPFSESEGDEGTVERDVRLDQVVAEPGDRLYYDYDFGDGWEHTIKVESVAPHDAGAPRARCVGGKRACPPEDVGGLGGYEEVLDSLARPAAHLDEWAADKLEWLPEGFDPAVFDLAETDHLVRRVAAGASFAPPDPDGLSPGLAHVMARLDHLGAGLAAGWLAGAADGPDLDAETAAVITAPWRAFLTIVGDGLTLTGAGYLPPAVVVTLVEELPLRHVWGKGNREERTPPVADLHETARAMGLVRKAKGKLLPTVLGRALRGDPEGLARHLMTRLVTDKRAAECDAGWLTVLAAAGGAEDPYVDIADALTGMGWRDQFRDRLEWHDVYHLAHHSRAVLSLAGWNPRRHADLEHDARARVLAKLALWS